MALYPVILAGGSGRRLWPLSTQHVPKQFLKLIGKRSLYQESILRLDGTKAEKPLVICNETHASIALSQSQAIKKDVLGFILEPEGRNTAPALTAAALFLKDLDHDKNTDPILLAMPADHEIKDVGGFQNAVNFGVSFAEEGHMVTFGIVPNFANTGYGYIKKGGPVKLRSDKQEVPNNFTALEIEIFTEKPNLKTASDFMHSRQYLWNSGIFLVNAFIWIEWMQYYRPDIVKICTDAYNSSQKSKSFIVLDRSLFITCPAESIDYAVIEQAAKDNLKKTSVVPVEIGWSDLGSWSQIWEESVRDKDGNVTKGNVYAESTGNSLLLAHHRSLAAVGLQDTIVIETNDAVLVAHKDNEHDIRKIVEHFHNQEKLETQSNQSDMDPDQNHCIVYKEPNYDVRNMTVNAVDPPKTYVCEHTENWIVIKGTAKVTTDAVETFLSPGQNITIHKGWEGQVENIGLLTLEIIVVRIL